MKDMIVTMGFAALMCTVPGHAALSSNHESEYLLQIDEMISTCWQVAQGHRLRTLVDQ